MNTKTPCSDGLVEVSGLHSFKEPQLYSGEQQTVLSMDAAECLGRLGEMAHARGVDIITLGLLTTPIRAALSELANQRRAGCD